MGGDKGRVLVTGALGQIGSELTPRLREIYGNDNVVASDIRKAGVHIGPFEVLDVLNKDQLERVVKEHKIDIVYHLAAILSATGEKNPDLAWTINVEGFRNVLNIAKDTPENSPKEEPHRSSC